MWLSEINFEGLKRMRERERERETIKKNLSKLRGGVAPFRSQKRTQQQLTLIIIIIIIIILESTR